MVISVELYPSTKLKVSYVLVDIAGNLITRNNWRDNTTDVITFKLYISDSKFLPQTDIAAYSDGGPHAGEIVTFSGDPAFTTDDIGKVYKPQVAVLRDGDIIDEEDLPKAELQITVGKPSRLRE